MTEHEEKPVVAAPAESGVKKAPVSFKHLIGVKRNMTQIFAKDGALCGVTPIDVTPAIITAIRTKERDQYTAVQLSYGARKTKNVSKPLMGQFKASGAPAGTFVREFRVNDLAGFEIGQRRAA